MSAHASAQRSRSTTKIRPMSPTQRKSLATQQLLSIVSGTDQSAVVTAALEVINEWIALDRGVQRRLREKYDELATLTSGKAKADLGPVPVPTNPVSFGQFNPYGRFDPYQLLTEYGRDQLRAVLARGTQKDLREATDIVQERNPGTRPSSRSSKAAMADYIMEHVAGPGY